jgi:hypothetical protein
MRKPTVIVAPLCRSQVDAVSNGETGCARGDLRPTTLPA